MARSVVFTGGEPGLQVTPLLVAAFKARQWKLHIETNGTCRLPKGFDWVVVSPKAGVEVVDQHYDEVRVTFPVKGLDPLQLAYLAAWKYVSPLSSGDKTEVNTDKAVAFCRQNPAWSLSLQTHKMINIQ